MINLWPLKMTVWFGESMLPDRPAGKSHFREMSFTEEFRANFRDPRACWKKEEPELYTRKIIMAVIH